MSTQDDELVATADSPEGAQDEGGEEQKPLDMQVGIETTGPCKRHVTLEISAADVKEHVAKCLKDVRKDAELPGFRPGHAPTDLVRKRYRKELASQVKSSLLLAALEQLDKKHKLNTIAEPKLDLEAIELPENGPMKIEFDLEVEPEFEVPKYQGLALKRPVKEITKADIDEQLKSFLERYAQEVPKESGTAEPGDLITADLTFHKDQVIFNTAKEVKFRLLPELRFQDGHVPDLAGALVGSKAGDVRVADAKVGTASADPAIRGQDIRITFHVHDLKQFRLPELDAAFFAKLGFDDEAELREGLKGVLERRVSYNQTQALRKQIVDQLIDQVPFDLPSELVARQEAATLRRLVDEMREAGLSDNELRARRAQIKSNAHDQTLRSLKEYFLLAKIAEAEEIKVEESDFDDEIEAIALRANESVRRVRARVRNEGLVDALSQQILERKTLAFIQGLATISDTAMTREQSVETLDDHLAAPAPAEGEAPADASDSDESNARD